jgi:glycosyltransferase involved in cell wall biosynthesis
VNAADSAAVTAPAAACGITVIIPARDEASSIGATLAALAAQRDPNGRPLPSDFFDIIVFANNCSDDTAAVVRSIAERVPQIAICVIENTLRPEDAHIGTARKYVMDLAAHRFLAAGKPDGIIASLDSDTLPDQRWIYWIARELQQCDAVAGHVTLAEADCERLLAPVRLLYAREQTYRRVLAEVESLIDPRPEDPQPRHGSFVGASFAISARTYLAAGGLPPLRRLEDVEFSLALRRIDARVRHSPFVRAATSARLDARVDGGFGAFLAELHACAERGESFTVEHPQRSLEDLECRAALRRVWQGQEHSDDPAHVAAIFNLPPEHWRASIDPALPFGTVWERLAQRAECVRKRYAPARAEFAIAALRAAALAAKSHRLDAREEDADERGTLDTG